MVGLPLSVNPSRDNAHDKATAEDYEQKRLEHEQTEVSWQLEFCRSRQHRVVKRLPSAVGHEYAVRHYLLFDLLQDSH